MIFQVETISWWINQKSKRVFYAHEDNKIEGIEFLRRYSPSAQWTTVFLLLILEVVMDLKSNQCDFAVLILL